MYLGIPGLAKWARRIVVALLAATVASRQSQYPKFHFRW